METLTNKKTSKFCQLNIKKAKKMRLFKCHKLLDLTSGAVFDVRIDAAVVDVEFIWDIALGVWTRLDVSTAGTDGCCCRPGVAAASDGLFLAGALERPDIFFILFSKDLSCSIKNKFLSFIIFSVLRILFSNLNINKTDFFIVYICICNCVFIYRVLF